MSKVLIFLELLLSLQISVYAFTVPDRPTGYVNDYAGILSADVKQNLEEKLQSFTASTSNEIAVVTIPSLEGETVERYATKLFETWKIGTAKNDNGVLLLISRDDRELRIEVGYGLEGAIPDILASDIIENHITPSFKAGDYDTGVLNGVLAIMEASNGEYVQETKSGAITGVVMPLLFIVLQGLLFFVSILGRSKSWWAGGVLGGIAGGVLTLLGVFGISLFTGLVVTVLLAVVGLFFDYLVSKTYNNAITQGSTIPWWVGGRGLSGRSSGSSASFGGFSGGSSGGGGASGRW